MELGFHVAAELKVWWLYAGTTLGVNMYAGGDNGVPISGYSLAGHVGLAPPLLRWRVGDHLREVDGFAAVEIGRREYEVSGSRSQFLGPEVSYEGPSEAVGFTGARAGVSVGEANIGGRGAGFLVKFELVGRRDRDTVELEYTRESCGGLFGGSSCSTSDGVTRAGGKELAVVLSAGLLLGR